MSFAGEMHTYHIDYNSCRNDDTVGAMDKFSDSPGQTQVFPARVGQIVLANDPDVGVPRYARVIERGENGWMRLQLLGNALIVSYSYAEAGE